MIVTPVMNNAVIETIATVCDIIGKEVCKEVFNPAPLICVAIFTFYVFNAGLFATRSAMEIERNVPMPETAATRLERLMMMTVGDSIFIDADNMQNWRYPLRRAMEDGKRFYFSRKVKGKYGHRVWRKS